jgi:hypothetical protein
MRTTSYRGSRSPKDREERIVAYERATIASRLRAGLEPLCTHDHVAPAVRLDPTLDNAARAAIQGSGQKACRLAQAAAMAAEAE